MSAGRQAVGERFVETFITGWSYGDRDTMVAHFTPWLRPDTRLVQPFERTHAGPEGFAELFARVFALIPDLRARVLRSAPSPDGVIIEFELHGTLGGRPVVWNACDRIILDPDGHIVERRSYFDPTRLPLAILRRPRAWRRWWASGVGPPRRRRRGTQTVRQASRGR
jgi:SnoaL-like domain